VPDLVICGAGGGPQDQFELQILARLGAVLDKPVPVLFSKPCCGETFAVGSMLSLAMAWDILQNHTSYPAYRIQHSLAGRFADEYDPGVIRRVLLVGCSREGDVAMGVLTERSASQHSAK
jgi:hypothetical protein